MKTEEQQPSGQYANRTRARRAVFQILYQEDMNPGSAEQFAEEHLEEELPDHEPLRDFARTLVAKTKENRREIDQRIEQHSHHWAVSRMNATDRNILRLAICEMDSFATPRNIVINEAVELAKLFGTKDSPQFVNGILDKFKHTNGKW